MYDPARFHPGCGMLLSKLIRSSLVVALSFISTPGFSEVHRFCLISYQTEEGWSDEYKMEVTFVTGQELNRKTNSFDFDYFGEYVLIWFSQDQVAIVKIDEFLITGPEFTAKDFRSAFLINQVLQGTQANSSSDRQWRIRGKQFVTWVDPRAAGY